MARRYAYARMTSRELSAAIDQLDLTMRQFARLAGSDPSRVERWLAGSEDIPHHIGLICVLLTLPGGMDLAKRYTDRMATVREDISPSK